MAGLLPVCPASADDRGNPIEVAGWVGGAYDDEAGSYSHCSVYSPYESGISLYFQLYANGAFLIGLANDDWSLGTGKAYSVQLSIDGGYLRNATGDAEGDVIWIDLAQDAQFYRAVQKGRRLTVSAARDEFAFDLSGTNAALNHLAACSLRFIGYSPIGDPFAAPPAVAESDSGGTGDGEPQKTGNPAPSGAGKTKGVFDPDEVLDLLDQAEFPRAVLVGESELPLFEGEVPFMAWLSEDEEIPLLGYLLFVQHTDQPRAALKDLVDVLLEGCPFRTAANYDALVERAGQRVAAASALCESEEAVEVTYFAAVSRRQGVFIFAHAGTRETTALIKDINARLKDALLGFSY